eukprot:jgi/Botrbrau1/18971/Bobra.0100s0008.1
MNIVKCFVSVDMTARRPSMMEVFGGTDRGEQGSLWDQEHDRCMSLELGQASLNRTSAPQAGRSQSAGGPSEAPAGNGVTTTGK